MFIAHQISTHHSSIHQHCRAHHQVLNPRDGRDDQGRCFPIAAAQPPPRGYLPSYLLRLNFLENIVPIVPKIAQSKPRQSFAEGRCPGKHRPFHRPSLTDHRPCHTVRTGSVRLATLPGGSRRPGKHRPSTLRPALSPGQPPAHVPGAGNTPQISSETATPYKYRVLPDFPFRTLPMSWALSRRDN